MSDCGSWEAVVVGGGLVGASVACHLARAGIRSLLVEQGDLASGASGANFGNVQVEDAEFGLSLELTLRSYARFASLAAELDYDVGFRKTGNLLLVENEQQWAAIEARAVRLQAAGVKAELLDRAALRHLERAVAADRVLGGLYNPDEGMVDPLKLVHAYALRGRDCGLEIWTHTRASAIEVQRGRVTGLATTRGSVRCRSVILAAGAWSQELARTAGLDLPLKWVHGEAAVTETLPPVVANAMTMAAFFETTETAGEQSVGFCVRQRPHGNVMIGEAALATQRLARDCTALAMPAVAAEARRLLPGLTRANVIRSWAIPVAFTADSRPLLGPVDGVDGLLVATALKSTIVLTPLVGELVAAMIAGRLADSRLTEFSPSRQVADPA